MGKEKKKRRKLISFSKKIGLAVIIIYIIVPVTLYCLIDVYDVISSNINADDWLMFWATYLAGTLGGLATLVAMKVTVDNSYKQQKEAQEIRNHEIEEERKYQYSPYLSVQVMTKSEVPESSKVEEICRYVFESKTDIASITAGDMKECHLYFEIKNIGFGPATNIFLFYDSSYIVNGTNSYVNCQKDFYVKECFNLGKETKSICHLTLFISYNLLEKNSYLKHGLTVDILHQDILGNVMRKRVCFSLNDQYLYSEDALEYLSFDELRKEYPNIQGITKLFVESKKKS